MRIKKPWADEELMSIQKRMPIAVKKALATHPAFMRHCLVGPVVVQCRTPYPKCQRKRKKVRESVEDKLGKHIEKYGKVSKSM